MDAVRIEALEHHYGARQALAGLDLTIAPGTLFALLGPNGGGKTTLFRILATLLAPTRGRASLFGHDVVREPDAVRRLIGVVFQSPAVDRLLTVRENLEVQGRLYGLSGRDLRREADALLASLRLADRQGDRVGTLSGGLMRRVEIAKGLLHRPRLFLLDEPSTGLDPAARQDLWDLLRDLRQRDGVTIVMTTHLMEEAEACDQLAILSQGRLVACGTPRQLKDEIGGDVIVLTTADAASLRADVERVAGTPARLVDGTLRLECARGHTLIPRLAEAFPGRFESINLGRPTLLDVFVRRTGLRFETGDETSRQAGGRP